MSTFEEKWGNEEEYGYKATWEQEQSANYQKNTASECASSIALPHPTDKNFRRMKALLTPEDNFKYDVDKISQYLNEEENIKINVDDRNAMCILSSTINNINVFNAAAYVIGYWVTNGGKKIDDKKWVKIFKDKKEVININFGADYDKKANVYPADVLRYARYIINKKQS